MKVINFDHNATTPISGTVLQKMNEIYLAGGNSMSVHNLGRRASMQIEKAREDILQILKGGNYELFFTSSGTEANNMALLSQNFSQIFYSKIEHASIYEIKPQNVEIVEIAVDGNGVIDLNDLQKKLDEKNVGSNFLLSLMLVNNETGAIQPVKEAAKIVHRKGGLIHSDLVQAIGKINVDLEDLNIDFATISAHKINGPQGAGALIARRGIDIKPLIFGGGHEKNKRAGTLNNAAIIGFAEAFKTVDQKILAMNNNIAKIRDFIEKELKNIAQENIIFFSQNVNRVANTSFFAVRNIDNQTQLIYFDLNKIAISNGSACSSGALKKSRILEAMNVSHDFFGSIRVSLGSESTQEEAEKFIAVFKEFYQK